MSRSGDGVFVLQGLPDGGAQISAAAIDIRTGTSCAVRNKSFVWVNFFSKLFYDFVLDVL
jgi:hypothetical protein